MTQKAQGLVMPAMSEKCVNWYNNKTNFIQDHRVGMETICSGREFEHSLVKQVLTVKDQGGIRGSVNGKLSRGNVEGESDSCRRRAWIRRCSPGFGGAGER